MTCIITKSKLCGTIWHYLTISKEKVQIACAITLTQCGSVLRYKTLQLSKADLSKADWVPRSELRTELRTYRIVISKDKSKSKRKTKKMTKIWKSENRREFSLECRLPSWCVRHLTCDLHSLFKVKSIVEEKFYFDQVIQVLSWNGDAISKLAVY